jgi:hypothetical protein
MVATTSSGFRNGSAIVPRADQHYLMPSAQPGDAEIGEQRLCIPSATSIYRKA